MAKQNNNFIKKNINITQDQKFKLEMYCLENDTNCSALIRDFIDGLVVQDFDESKNLSQDIHPNQTFINFCENTDENFNTHNKNRVL